MKQTWIILFVGYFFGIVTGWLFLGLLVIGRDLRDAKNIIDNMLRRWTGHA